MSKGLYSSFPQIHIWWEQDEVKSISGVLGCSYVYVPPYIPSYPKQNFRLVVDQVPRRADFAAVNAAMRTDTTATRRKQTEKAWGSRRYRTGSDIIMQRDDGLVGLLKERGRKGVEEVLECIEVLIEQEGIFGYTVKIRNNDYKTVVEGRDGTKLNITYDPTTEMVVIHRYKRELHGAAGRRAATLEETEPERIDHYAQDKGTTLYLGVKFMTEGNEVRPTIVTKRTTGLEYWLLKGERVSYNSPEEAVHDIAKKIKSAVITECLNQRDNFSCVFFVWHTNDRHVGYYTGPYYEAFVRGIQEGQKAVVHEMMKFHELYSRTG